MAKMRKKPKPRCSVCGRRPGHEDKARNRFGEPDPNPETPLGELATCDMCGLLDVCPECSHELECCELKSESQASGREDGKMRMGA